MPVNLLEKGCGPKCRSRKHVQEIISVIVYGTLGEFKAVSTLCHNWMRHSDVFGRTALHVAASCGKTNIVQWLLEEKRVDLGVKDFESGYTALHRSLFYGQIACARLLTQNGGDLQTRDAEGLSPLDIATLDRPPHIMYSLLEPNEVFAWGENTNSTLGHSSPHKRSTPEAVDTFKRAGISIKQCVLSKYHSVFLSQQGQVYTCGHGQGGRLGHGDQNTVLVPRLLETVSGLTCVQIAASIDHTVLKMDGGSVYSFGLNPTHQLGQTPNVESSLLPKQMNLKSLKGKPVSGICTGRFHTVLWTPDSVYTVGLNAGQLGHPKGERYQSVLRQVSGLRHTDIGIALVACSDAATACLTTKGDVFVLHDYQCRKITSKWQEIEQVQVTGGTLDHSTDLEKLSERGGQELMVMLRNASGQLFLWRQSSLTLKRCQFALKRQLSVSDVAMTMSSLILCTKRGEAFVGYLSNKKSVTQGGKETVNKETIVKESGDGFRLLDMLLREETEDIQVRRIPYVHRAVLVTGDRKGRNFVALQALPNGCLSELPSCGISEISSHFGQLKGEADHTDSIHDAIIQLGSHKWPIHKYVVASRSDNLRNQVLAAGTGGGGGEEVVLKVEGLSPEAVEQIITFMYTDTCDYLQLGHVVKMPESCSKSEPKPRGRSMSEEIDPIIPLAGESAFQVEQRRSKSKKERQKSESDTKDNAHIQNPVKQLQEAARKLGVKGLSKRLDAVKLVNGVITSQGKNLSKPKLKFDRTKFRELCDVTICTEDGQDLTCHKCVLVARLEYFYSMLATGWMESFNNSKLTLPVPGHIMEVLLNFLYTDEALQLRDCTSEDFLCNVLIMSDQMLCWRLKEMCEVALANIINFKNVGELLEFSSIYNAKQLKVSCQQFISYSMPAVVEGRFLDVLSEETMEELTKYYRDMIPNMCRRIMTAGSDDRLPQSYLDELLSEYESLDEVGQQQQHQTEQNSSRKSNKHQQKKKNRPRQKSGTDGESVQKSSTDGESVQKARSGMERHLSVSSDVSVKSEEDLEAIMEELDRNLQEEKKSTPKANKNRQKNTTKWQPLDMGVSPAPTQPEDVPVWSPSYRTLGWHTGDNRGDHQGEAPSPSVLASSPTSLRDIMQEESTFTDKKRSSFSGRFSWKEVKKQQQNQQQDCKDKAHQEISDGPTVPQLSPKASRNPWGSSVSGVVKSFRDLMIQEETVVTDRSSPRTILGKQPTSVSPSAGMIAKSPPAAAAACWGLPNRSSVRSQPVSLKPEPSSPPSKPDNPWQLRATQLACSPPSHTPPLPSNFSAILQDEQEKSDTLIRTTQKPLALIQLEEQAMCELLQHYKAKSRVQEYITVERVSKAMAAPLWKREQSSSHNL